MLLVSDIKKNVQIPMSEKSKELFGIDKLNIKRSSIPAVTHVDYSARIQTVHKDTNPKYHRLLSEFKKITGWQPKITLDEGIQETIKFYRGLI